jgi:hypothetical protein
VKLGRRFEKTSSRLRKSDLVEQLLEFQNAYAVVRAGWLKASAGKLAVVRKARRVEQKITNGQSI